MKITWEADDIKPGTVVGKSERVERWLIGYDPWAAAPNWALISLEDGMIAHSGLTKTELADKLNLSGYVPAVLFPL
jgi:hypothetical protein